ncbi:hypothetical protein AB0M12_39245 [Nocardia vinacea]|uniref:hypothetical protein n=1 Tax=Nocardia vinacea TaxID=96468 RepID=UPI003432A27A
MELDTNSARKMLVSANFDASTTLAMPNGERLGDALVGLEGGWSARMMSAVVPASTLVCGLSRHRQSSPITS